MPARGFTLIELLITITLFATLLSIGVPAFGRMIEAQRLDTAVDALTRALHATRQEAVRLNRPVTLAPADGDWRRGWRIFIDLNNNGEFDGNDRLLRADLDLLSVRVLANAPLARYVRYNARGESELLNGGFQAGTFRFCASGDTSSARAIVINRVGRVRVDRGAGSGGCG